MSKTVSGIPEIYNIKKSSQMELKYFKKKKKKRWLDNVAHAKQKLKELEIRTNWYESTLIV